MASYNIYTYKKAQNKGSRELSLACNPSHLLLFSKTLIINS